MTETPHRWRRRAVAAAALAAFAMPALATDYVWNGGSFIAGVTAPSPLAATDVLHINAGANKFFNGSSFINGGRVDWNADPLFFQNAAAVVNNGLWNATSDQQMLYNGGSAPSFTNNGIFRKTGGSGSTTINNTVGFVNNGTLDAATGSIVFVGGSTFNAGSVFSGAGVVNVAAGNNTFAGSFTSSNLRLSGGGHVGNGAVLGGVATFTGGTLAGSWTIGSGQTLNGAAGANKFISGNGTLVDNQGLLAWNSGDSLYLENGALLRNQGLFVANQSMAVTYNGGSGPALQNTGTLRAAAGATLTVGNTTGFVNDAGTLDAIGTIRFVGGSSFNAGSVFSGSGSNVAAGSNSFAGSLSSANLVLESGVHAGSAALIGGSVAWTGGAITGSWGVAAGQALNAGDGATKMLTGSGTVLTNQGRIAWGTTQALYLQQAAVLDNQGLFVADADTAVVYNGGSAPGFVNRAAGTVRAAAGRTLTIGAATGFVNDGGRLDAEAGATIVYAGGSQFRDGSRFTGAGSNVAAGANAWSGSLDSANLVLQSGTHAGSAAVIGGSVAWTGGWMTGTWGVAAGQALSAGDGSSKILTGVATVLTNQGRIDWAPAQALYLEHGAVLRNQGLFVAGANTSVLYNGGSQTGFDNTGTVRAAAGATLLFGGGAGLVNNGGTLEAEAGATIRYGGGAVFNAGSSFSGAGSNIANGSNRWNGGFTSTNLQLQSGTHVGGDAVVGGVVAWTGGNLSGNWQVAAGQTLQGGGGSAKIVDGATLVNDGRIAWQGGDLMYLQGGAALVNAGTLDFGGDGGVLYNGGSAPSFVNTGLIVKSGGSGTTSIGNTLSFDNQGVIDVQSGTLALPNNFVNHGRLQGSTAYAVAGTLVNAGSVAPGASPGTLALQGNFAQTAAGSLLIDLESMASHDLFNISGSAALDGTLALQCWAACSLAVGDVVTILDAAGELSGSFASVTLNGFASGAFSVIYDDIGDRVLLQVTQNVTAAVPEPGSVAMLLAGLGVLAARARRRRAG